MSNLTKENFWNEMTQKYPLAMKDFCKWIDIYKNENKWRELFNAGILHSRYSTSPEDVAPIFQTTGAPKFHDLPLAIQMGIWNEYLSEYDFEKCKSDIEILLNGFEEGMRQSAEPTP